MKQSKRLLATLLILFVLQACGGEDNISEINDHLEETVQIEKKFEKKGEKIYELETKDESLYDEIIEMDEDHHDEIQDLANKALDITDERMKYLKKEKDVIEASQDVFLKIEPKIDEVKDNKRRNEVKEMYEVMDERYDAYGKFYDAYEQSLELSEDMYAIFQNEELNEHELYRQIERVNESYDEINLTYEVFNQKTEEFNDLKQDYLSSLEK